MLPNLPAWIYIQGLSGGDKRKIVELTMNNSGIRNSFRVLHISIDISYTSFKKFTPHRVTTFPLDVLEVMLI
ncbi:hypothetical protein BTN49_1467 [Candidatus Enterovibrio escicola]|uniref:Uncharacterized protein n=1 Tax=Candidatus Enterovibrio escicola TaxID=1927127 RepID=A0A2A5T417_9GAMM|nr:hypothetical protein BTN49_1467 [Candidatus Enterovibrio escacola]